MNDSTYGAAQELADRVARYEKWIDEAPIHRGRDFAEHMADPTATSEDFYREYDERMSRMEAELRDARNELAAFEHQHRGLLVAVGWFQTDGNLDDAECPDCFADAFRPKGTDADFQCAGCHRRFPEAERSTRRLDLG
ncbi:hypothetical protein [Nocardia sp. NPDC003963]